MDRSINERTPKVSVVVRVYNAEKHLEEALRSAFNQTYQDFEIVIIDDGSIDSSASIVRSFDDPRIRYIYQENRGKTASARRMIEESRGDYIAVLDADDIWELTKLEKQMQTLDRNPRLVLVSTNISIIDDNNQIVGTRTFPSSNDSIQKSLLLYNCITHSAALFSRKKALTIGGYANDMICEDYDLWLRLKHKGEIACIQEPLVRYRIKSGPLDAKHLKYVLLGTINARNKAFENQANTHTAATRLVSIGHHLLQTIPSVVIDIGFRIVFYGLLVFRTTTSRSRQPQQ